LFAALEGELDVRVLGDGRTPIGDEHGLAAMLEGQLLDEMRRDHLSLRILDEAGIHRVPAPAPGLPWCRRSKWRAREWSMHQMSP